MTETNENEPIIVENIIELDSDWGILVKYKLSNEMEIIAKLGKYKRGSIITDISREVSATDVHMHKINDTLVTYQRNISNSTEHYCKITTIKEKCSMQKADKLEIIKFEKLGWQVISQKDLHKLNNEIVYIPPGTILPLALSEEIHITKYLSDGIVRAMNLRSERSEGVIIDVQMFNKWKDYIFEYNEAKEHKIDMGSAVSDDKIPYGVDIYRKTNNLKNIIDEFEDDEDIWVSEKIEGMNGRFGRFKSKTSGLYELFVGSHYKLRNRFIKKNTYATIIKYCPWIYYITTKDFRKKLSKAINYIDEHFREKVKTNCEFWNFVESLEYANELPVEFEIFFELYGLGVIPGFDYGLTEPTGRVIDIKYNGSYLAIQNILEFCTKYKLPVVNFTKMKFNRDELEKLANSPSEYTDKHIREGIVIRSETNMAKLKGMKYLEFKDIKKK